MPAYVVATMAIHDPATYRKYTDRTPATIKRHGGKFLTRGGEVTTFEGEKLTDRMVILEFPSKQHVEDWMKDPEYQEIVQFRHAASTSRVVVQEGSANTENPSPNV
jgi:uncharacterized protein (DUF1330 family)